MILKYRSYMKNWSYRESPSFTLATVAFEKPACPDAHTNNEELMAATIQQHKIDGKLREIVESAPDGGITYLIGNELFEPENGFTVVVPYHSNEAFVLTKEAYLMTDTGKTIERIA